MPKTTPQTILAFDPGLRDLGFAVTRGKLLLDTGVRTFRFTPRPRRLVAALRAVRELLGRQHPDVLVLEASPRSSHPNFRALRRFTRAVARLARNAGIPCVAYPVQEVRKALLGNGWASKRDVAVALAARHPGLRVYVKQNRAWKERYFQNLFDALALAVHHQARTR